MLQPHPVPLSSSTSTILFISTVLCKLESDTRSDISIRCDDKTAPCKVYSMMIPHVSLCWIIIVVTSILGIAQAQDSVYSGNYEILFCGAGKPDSKALRLQSIITHTMTHLQAVLDDVKLGTKSTHGFAAFFKTNNNIATVQKVFQAILDAHNIGIDNTNPVFACADPNEDLTKKTYADCLKWGTVAMGSWPQYGVMFICDFFWNLISFPFHSTCPSVSNNVLVPDNTVLSTNQFAVMVHELVHLYAPALTAIVDETVETYDVQKAVNLDAKASLANANNYALYAAGKVSKNGLSF
ncbi:MAG: hypothetical protein LQ347_005605 [Umbilicaria vellea]|nr:MAG: hypothetical protein LQ347_005605 [Umbilicaria vellea]